MYPCFEISENSMISGVFLLKFTSAVTETSVFQLEWYEIVKLIIPLFASCMRYAANYYFCYSYVLGSKLPLFP